MPRTISTLLDATLLGRACLPAWMGLFRRLWRLPLPIRWKVALYEKVFLRYFAWRPCRLQARLNNGMRLEVQLPDLVQSHLYCFGQWEPALTRYLHDHLRPGDCFIDIGANVGYFSLVASALIGPRGRVIAFEASPSIHERLVANARQNQAGNIEARNVAISDEPGWLDIWKNISGNAGNSTVSLTMKSEASHQKEGRVACGPLDQFMDVDAIESARFIKIDVEGHELEVLKGLSKHFKRMKADIVFEWSGALHASRQAQVDELLALFEAAGYRLSVLDNALDIGKYFSETTPNPPLAPFLPGAPGQQDVIASKLSRV